MDKEELPSYVWPGPDVVQRTRRVLIAAVCLWAATGSQSVAQTPVEVASVAILDLSTHLELVGKVVPQISTTISAEIAGRVEAVYVDEGTSVQRDSPLAHLDDDIQEVRRTQAEARFIQAERDFNFHQVRSQVETDLQSRVAGHRAETELALRNADYRLAQIALEHATIRSPIPGIISRRYAEIGEWITIGGEIADVIKTDTVFVVTSVGEQFVQKLAVGMKAKFQSAAYAADEFVGTLHNILPESTGDTHLFPIRFLAENHDGRLKSGMFIRIDLPLSQRLDVLMVPKDAVLPDGGGDIVFVVTDSTARQVAVQTGQSRRDLIAVFGDLQVDDEVVVTGNEALKDGQNVNIVRRPSPPETSH